MPNRRAPFEIGGAVVAPGSRETISIQLSVLSNHTPMNLPVQVIHGTKEGPVAFVSAAIHGDEIIGVEIIRRLSHMIAKRRLAGTVLLVPIVNTIGFIAHSRYLPDRRDLNRSSPGSAAGSLASQLAHRFLNDVVARCEFGIDLHSAAIHRESLPQIRANPDDEKSMDLARAFGAPIIIKSPLRDGSLRSAALKRGCGSMILNLCGCEGRVARAAAFRDDGLAFHQGGYRRIPCGLEKFVGARSGRRADARLTENR